GVSHVEYVGSYEKGTSDFIIEADKNVDIRRILFDECAKRNWYILMITPLGMSLEDIFIQLVNKNSEAKQLAENKEEEVKEESNDDGDMEA
ncbi:MAG: ABC transporter, partial [Clostridia bacterium]|nr:ABC transporter [Clostridia bacterium]